MTKVAILARVSKDEQSTERQIMELTQFAADRGWEVVHVERESISGATVNIERPSLQRIINLAKAKKISKVLVLEASRLGRNTGQVLQAIEDFNKAGVSLVVKNYDLETLKEDGSKNDNTQFLITILLDIGRMERATLIERTKSGLAAARKRGKKLGRPAGSGKSEEELEEQYKKVIKRLEDGYSVRETALLTGVSKSTVQRLKAKLNLGTGKEAI